MNTKGFICMGLTAVGVLVASACGPSSIASSPTDLTVEEHRLVEAPSTEPLAFKPVDGSMADILSRHAAERSKVIPDNSELQQGRHAMRRTLGSDLLTATENYDGNTGWVTVTRTDQEIYRIDTGMPSPIPGLQGLWTYDGHWVLETAYITRDASGGRLSRDGTLMRQLADDEETFDFQLMAGRPFFFSKVNGNISLALDDQEVATAYDGVPHYQCCSASVLNPLHAENMVAFFARRGDTWYYVEAGLFGD
jgi:hypothetical protein